MGKLNAKTKGNLRKAKGNFKKLKNKLRNVRPLRDTSGKHQGNIRETSGNH